MKEEKSFEENVDERTTYELTLYTIAHIEDIVLISNDLQNCTKNPGLLRNLLEILASVYVLLKGRPQPAILESVLMDCFVSVLIPITLDEMAL